MSLTLRQLVTIILLVVVMILIGTFYFAFHISAQDSAARASCQASIALALSTTQFGGVYNLFDLYCPRRVVSISQNNMNQQDFSWFTSIRGEREYMYDIAEIVDGSLRVRSVRQPPTPDTIEQAAKHIFSYELAECWSLFREGGVDVLRSDSAFWRSNVCIICAEIHFSDQLQDAVSLLELREHLQDQYTHRSREDPMSIERYLYADRRLGNAPQCLLSFPSFDGLVFDRNSYSVVYFRTGTRFLQLRDRSMLPCWGVGVIPTEDLSSYCDALVN